MSGTIIWCPFCKWELEKLDHTTFRCDSCESLYQIEEEIPDTTIYPTLEKLGKNLTSEEKKNE